MKSPVVIVGYTRVETLRLSLSRLARCHGVDGRELFLFLDAPYIEEHRAASNAMVELAMSFKDRGLPQLKVIRREKNYGIPRNQIDAITEIVDKYGQVIFFEDDVCVSETFLDYMDEALKRYRNDLRIFCVNGFFPTYMRSPKCDIWLQPRMCAWGWGIWKDRWHKVDFELKDFDPGDLSTKLMLDRAGGDVHQMCAGIKNGSLKTWDVQCSYYIATHGLYAIAPRFSLTKCIGFGIGTNCRSNAYLARLRYYNFNPEFPLNLEPDGELLAAFRRRPGSLLGRVYYRILRTCSHLVPDLHLEPVLPVRSDNSKR